MPARTADSTRVETEAVADLVMEIAPLTADSDMEATVSATVSMITLRLETVSETAPSAWATLLVTDMAPLATVSVTVPTACDTDLATDTAERDALSLTDDRESATSAKNSWTPEWKMPSTVSLMASMAWATVLEIAVAPRVAASDTDPRVTLTARVKVVAPRATVSDMDPRD